MQERLQRAFDRALIPDRYRNAKIADFAKSVVDPVLKAQLDNRSVWIHGGTGTGKTHLAIAVLRDCLTRSEEVAFISLVDLLERIKATFVDHQRGDDPFETACKIDVLALDDIASERPTPFAEDILSRLVDYRYNWQKRTIFTSNAGLTDLGGIYSARIISRLLEQCDQIKLTGKDRRVR